MTSPKPSALGDYIIKLSKDPGLAEKLRQDPKTALASSGLSIEDQKLVSTGNINGIRKALSGHPGVTGDTIVVVVIAVIGL